MAPTYDIRFVFLVLVFVNYKQHCQLAQSPYHLYYLIIKRTADEVGFFDAVSRTSVGRDKPVRFIVELGQLGIRRAVEIRQILFCQTKISTKYKNSAIQLQSTLKPVFTLLYSLLLMK